MLEKQINGFIEYCKVCGFKDRSIQSLSINTTAQDFEVFSVSFFCGIRKQCSYAFDNI